MNDSLILLFNIFSCFFACVGVVYVFRDFLSFIKRGKKICDGTLVLDLRNNRVYALKAIVALSDFLKSQHASRYIEKVIIKGLPSELEAHRKEISNILKIRVEFE